MTGHDAPPARSTAAASGGGSRGGSRGGAGVVLEPRPRVLDSQRWAVRAGMAERAVHARHLRRLWGMPGTVLGVSGAPHRADERLFGPFNYWWQAHLLDCLVDAYLRSPDHRRRRAVRRAITAIRVRNGGSWANDYYDDMAWLALALLRAERYAALREPGAVALLADRLRAAWTDDAGGGIWWRLRDKYGEDFKNVPANGPAAILAARLSDPPTGMTGIARTGVRAGADRLRARALVSWIDARLLDPGSGLVYDGLHVRPDGGVREVEATIYTYCQGVYLGACVELAVADKHVESPGNPWADRGRRTVEAVTTHLTDPSPRFGPVLRGAGGGDGGLFAGILARYLALAAIALPTLGARYTETGQAAADLVFNAADAVWYHRAVSRGSPVFGADWTQPAAVPARRRRGAREAEGDLSVQVGAWMLLEAAAALERAGYPARRTAAAR
jgi:predicted alpha-1,6-mannanase (GH76 family)